MALSRRYFEYVDELYIDSNGNVLLTTLPEDIVTVQVGMLFQKVNSNVSISGPIKIEPLERLFQGSVYMSRFNPVIRQIKEAGLIDYWARSKKAKNDESDDFVNVIMDDRYLPLTLNDSQGAFILLAIGLIVSLIVHSYEIIKNKRHPRRQNGNMRLLIHRDDSTVFLQYLE